MIKVRWSGRGANEFDEVEQAEGIQGLSPIERVLPRSGGVRTAFQEAGALAQSNGSRWLFWIRILQLIEGGRSLRGSRTRPERMESMAVSMEPCPVSIKIRLFLFDTPTV